MNLKRMIQDVKKSPRNYSQRGESTPEGDWQVLRQKLGELILPGLSIKPQLLCSMGECLKVFRKYDPAVSILQESVFPYRLKMRYCNYLTAVCCTLLKSGAAE